MDSKKEGISGWYSKSNITSKMTEGESRQVDQHIDRLIKHNYKRLPAEIPGKMMLALGKLAIDRGIKFTDLVEEILDKYLKEKGVEWEKAK